MAERRLFAIRVRCEAEYRRFVETLRRRMRVFEGEEGFFPPSIAPGTATV